MPTSPEPSDDEELVLPAETDPLLERALQLYLEYRVHKRPPESAPGAARKVRRWLLEEAQRQDRPVDPEWERWLARMFLDVEGDVSESTARRRQARRTRPRA